MKPYKLPKGYLDFQSFNKHLLTVQMLKPKPIDVLGMPDVPRNLSHIYKKGRGQEAEGKTVNKNFSSGYKAQFKKRIVSRRIARDTKRHCFNPTF